jgi:hypothetical protein
MRNLWILREQIAPFDIKLTRVERLLDFTILKGKDDNNNVIVGKGICEFLVEPSLHDRKLFFL